MKDKIILIIVLLAAAILIHPGKNSKLDMAKFTAQEKSLVQFGLAAGM